MRASKGQIAEDITPQGYPHRPEGHYGISMEFSRSFRARSRVVEGWLSRRKSLNCVRGERTVDSRVDRSDSCKAIPAIGERKLESVFKKMIL